MKHVLARRLGVLTLGSALALGTTIAPAHADATPAGSLATGWLAGELVDGLVPGQFGPDYGNSIDAAFSALASGDTATAATIRDAVAANLGAYITGEAFGDTGSTYAGAAAKALVLAQRTGGNPRSFGGVDLVARVEAVTQPSGRIRDTSTFGDFANTLGQSFAALGLTTAGSAEAPAARAFLRQQQCGGVFRLELGDQPCTAAGDPSANVDATGLAVQALVGNADSTGAVGSAVAFLTSTQRADGAFASDASLPAVNTNSTGLAAAGLGAACAVGPAQRGAAWVRGLQVPAGAAGALAGDAGVIAYDRAAYTGAETGGVPTDPADREAFRRATVQAAPALIWDASAPATVTLTGPSKVAPGTTQDLTVSGAAKGETVCVTTPAGVQRLVGTGSPLTVPVTAPATGSAAYSATTGPGAAGFTLTTAQARAQLKTKRVQVGDKVKVKVRNLVPGTKVVSKIRGTKVDSTRANAKGVATVRFTLRGKAAKAARVGTIRRGEVAKETLKMKPAGQKAVKKTLRITKP